DTVRLAKARTLALNYVRPPEYDSSTVVHQTLGKLAKLDFDASGVNLSTSTITFRNPHGLKDGQAVTYYGTASAPDANGVEQNSGVEPLFQGKTYYVKKVSDTAIQLSATKDGGAITLTSAGVGTHSLLYQDQASTNTFDPEQDVDNEANTIKFASPHGFQTGDAVIYHTDPDRNRSGEVSEEGSSDTLEAAAPDRAIGDLEDGWTYFV